MRKKTLGNLKAPSDRLRTATDAEMNGFKIVSSAILGSLNSILEQH